MLSFSGGISGSYALNVLSGRLNAESINVNTLTIGSGAFVSIQPIAGGPLSVAITAVPEPSTIALLGVSAISILLVWGRRKWAA